MLFFPGMFPLLLLAAALGSKADADALLAAGRFPEAARMYLELLDKSPRDLELMEGAGDCFLHGGRPRDAVLLFERALALAPADSKARLSLAAALVDLNAFERAYPLLGQVTAATPQDPVGWYLLGLLMYRNGYYAVSIEHLDRALANGSGRGGLAPEERRRAEVARAVALAQEGRAAEAEPALRRLLGEPANASNLDLRLSLVRLEYEAGHYDAALAESGRALAVDASNSAVHFWRARIFQQRGEFARAVDEAERSRDLAPDSPAPRNLLVRLYIKMDRRADSDREAAWLRQREAGAAR